MHDFIRELVNATLCSTEYAVSVWNMLSASEKENPRQAAKDHIKANKLNRHSFD